MSDIEAWMKELRSICREDVDDEFLRSAIEELCESCMADTPKAQAVIENLVLKCHADEKKLRKLVKKISQDCPVDEERELQETEHEEADWAEAETAEAEEFTRNVPERDGVR